MYDWKQDPEKFFVVDGDKLRDGIVSAWSGHKTLDIAKSVARLQRLWNSQNAVVIEHKNYGPSIIHRVI